VATQQLETCIEQFEAGFPFSEIYTIMTIHGENVTNRPKAGGLRYL
jgi:hypothetical protein